MILNLKRYISILLVLMLLIGIVPKAYAADLLSDSTSPEDTITETTAPLQEVTEPTEATEASMSAPAADDYGIMPAASTQSGILLFDYSDNGNYTTSLNNLITVVYKWNGTGTTRTCNLKNFGWHFARINNVPYPDDPLYCIEPHLNYAASTPGNSVDRGVTLSGSGTTSGTNVWYSLSAERREAIALVLLYTKELWDHSISVTTTAKANNPNVPLRMAAQFLIFEIVCGLRNAETFVRNSSNESGTSGNIFYNAGTASIPNFASNYDSLVTQVQSAKKIPSFTSSTSSTAPTIPLVGDKTSVTDTNGVLGNFTFTNGNGVSFSKSGNTLEITRTGSISASTVFQATRNIPSAANTTFNIWYMSGSTYQTTISLYSPATGTLNGYFKLEAPKLGTLDLRKITEDGQNLAGWQFGIYADAACLTLVSGPHVTDSDGNISVTDLEAGTVYVKELGHTDSNINAQYVCTSPNPLQVEIISGTTSTVTFNNDLARGIGRIVKITAAGRFLGGWKFNLYTDEALTQLVDGSPFITSENGGIDIELYPGDYWCNEIDESDEHPYWIFDKSVKKVTVKAGETATVTFENIHCGRGRFKKSMPDGGSVEGWTFNVYRSGDAAYVGTFVSGEDGTVMTGLLLPGEYLVYEEIPEDSLYICETPNPQTITIAAGETAEVTFTNRLKPAEIIVYKVDALGAPLAEAEFLLEWSEDGTTWQVVTYTDSENITKGTCTSTGLTDGKLVSGRDGLIHFTGLQPELQYRLTETKAPEGYFLLTEPAYEGSISLDETLRVELTVVNAPVYELPMTGSAGSTVATILQTAGAVVLLIVLLYIAKKHR